MIKLNRNFTPIFFNPQNVSVLTAKFANNNKARVWHHYDVREACMTLSTNKCAYCEVMLDQKSTYMEVEHFKHKDAYPNEVIKWTNLLPSCRHCNGSKGDHDVVKEPIVNPCIDNPPDHFEMTGYRLIPKTPLGEMSIEVLNLNDVKHYVIPRCGIGSILSDNIELAQKYFQEYIANRNTKNKRKVVNLIRAILVQCQSDALFAAVSASVLHENRLYKKLVPDLMSQGLWASDLKLLHDNSLILCL
ncbi:hypothetical protein SC206_02155 [Rouxiella sp. T17]|uniref:hypothetical protein n=1 Tax=Rouxiella sp. T17 TaxID=3085684 RepID=UPI002FC835D8